MSNFAKIPFLILSRIVYEVINKNIILLDSKSDFAILQVCSAWRLAAVDQYYEWAYFIYNKKDSSLGLKSNFSLVSSLGYSVYSRFIRIRLQSTEQLVDFLDQYESLIQANKNNWSKVYSFDFIYDDILSINHSVEHRGKMVNLHDKLIYFSRYIVKWFPNIEKLHLNYYDLTTTTNTATDIFFSAFSKTITHLNGKFVSTFHNNYSFDNLTHLNLEINPEAEQILPRLDYSKIKAIKFTSIPYTFKWGDMFTDTDVDNYTFKALKSLNLEFENNYTEEEIDEFISSEQSKSPNMFTVNFPVLADIYLREQPSWYISTKTKYCFSSRLKLISLFNLYDYPNMLDYVNSVCISNLTVGYHKFYKTKESGFYNLSSKLFHKTAGGKFKSSKLMLSTDECVINWDNTNWDSLNLIQLHSCNAATFVACHMHCPQLVSIKVGKLTVEMPLYKVEALFKDGIVDRFSRNKSNPCNVKSLMIREFESSVVETSEFATFVKVYLKHCRSLVHVNITKGQWMNIETYIDSLKQYYPHLRNMVPQYKCFCNCC